MTIKYHRNTPRILLIAAIMISLLSLTGCGTEKEKAAHESGIRVEKLLNYKNASTADTSSIGNIMTALPAGQYNHRYKLGVDPQPHEVLFDFSDFDKKRIPLTFDDGSSVSLTFHDTMLKDAMLVLSLVPDAEIITFVIPGGSLTYKRGELYSYYGDLYGEKFERITADKVSIIKFVKGDL